MKKTKMLKKNYEFSNILSKGTYYSGKQIEIFIKMNKDSANYLGLAIGVKTGKAYQRNRVKRVIREVYKEAEESLKDGVSMVILIKKNISISEITYKQIKEDMHQICKKAKIIEE